MVGFTFHEVMEGTVVRAGERFDRPFRFDFEVSMPDAFGFLSSVIGECAGRVRIDGLAKDRQAKGTLELSPVRKRMMRYAFTFEADDGQDLPVRRAKDDRRARLLARLDEAPGPGVRAERRGVGRGGAALLDAA